MHNLKQNAYYSVIVHDECFIMDISFNDTILWLFTLRNWHTVIYCHIDSLSSTWWLHLETPSSISCSNQLPENIIHVMEWHAHMLVLLRVGRYGWGWERGCVGCVTYLRFYWHKFSSFLEGLKTIIYKIWMTTLTVLHWKHCSW